MSDVLLDKNLLVKEYIDKAKSTTLIAKELGTHPNAVRRALIKCEIPLRTRSQSQKLSFSEGRKVPPLKDKVMDAATRLKISEALSESWKNMDPVKLKEHTEKSRERWNALSMKEKQTMWNAGAKAIRKTAKEGSQLEQYILVELKKAGYNAEFHKLFLTTNEKLEVDIYIPEIKTVIEIDGPSHFFPVWGEEALAKNRRADNDKSGNLISKGYVVVRVCHIVRNSSQAYKRGVSKQILDALSKIKTNFPPIENRLINLVPITSKRTYDDVYGKE